MYVCTVGTTVCTYVQKSGTVVLGVVGTTVRTYFVVIPNAHVAPNLNDRCCRILRVTNAPTGRVDRNSTESS